MQTDYENEVKLTLLDFAGQIYSGTFNPQTMEFSLRAIDLPFPVGNPMFNNVAENPRYVYLCIHFSSYYHEFYNGIMKFDMWRQMYLLLFFCFIF